MTRWLVTGARGLLGRELVARLEGEGEPVTGLAHHELDVTDAAAAVRAVRGHRADVVVNCAAWTAVDEAEDRENAAGRVNGLGPLHLANACAAGRARLIQVSTDYVFSGTAGRPYPERGATGPRTAYGRTKLAGERAVLRVLPAAGLVVRTAWLYGAHGPNFVRTMIGLERGGQSVPVVADQRGQPTWTADVAGQILALVRSGAPAGIYHATSSGEATWFDLAAEVFRLLGADPARVRPVPSAGYPRRAPRPAYSVLGHAAWAGLGIPAIGDWRLRLREALPLLAAA